ncbi:hypothetical protein [Algoriphagus litoralis]|uniref:hypothetical protein n=1 Tax=Algoriphagus litoralis TaxID=2202829 RepID=UPI000DBA69A7|nr:hypothetical protein [Algoriphagus litoralis]
MAFLQSMYRTFSRLSLDVVGGALAGLLFFSKLFHTELDPLVYQLLGMAVWCIYTLDHVLDSRQLTSPVSSRFAFYQKFGGILMLFVVPIALCGLFLAYRVLGLGGEFYLSIGFGAIILLTMLLVRKAGKAAGLIKEFSTAVFYVLGIAWIPLLRLEGIDLTWQNLLFIPAYIGLAFLNLLMFSFLDRKEDETHGFASAALTVEPGKLLIWIRRLAFLLIFLSLAGFIFLPSFYRPFACVLLLMLLVHYLTFFATGISIEAKRGRMEASFMFPVLLLLL